MKTLVYVYADIYAANNFAELLIKNSYTDSTTYVAEVNSTLGVFFINIVRKEFSRFYGTEADCLTTEEFTDLFL